MNFVKKNTLWIKSKFKIKLINQKIKTLNVSLVESRSIMNNDNIINNTLSQDNGLDSSLPGSIGLCPVQLTTQKNITKLSKNMHTMGTLKHYPPAIKEWYNSIYSFYPNDYFKLLPSIDKSVYSLLKGYFNLNPSLTSNTKDTGILNSSYPKGIPKRLKKFSMIKLFLGKPEIKHSNNKVIITIYIYNRKKIYFLNKIKKIIKIHASRVPRTNVLNSSYPKGTHLNKFKKLRSNKLNNKKLLYGELRLLKKKLKKLNIFLFNVLKNKSTPFLFIYLQKKLPFLFIYLKKRSTESRVASKINSINLKPFLNNVESKKIININRDSHTGSYSTITYKKLVTYKYYCSMLYFNSYIFNANNLLPLKNILKKIYNKKIEFNIINLKYLYLDSNILAQAISIKLKDRQKRILRILKLGLKLTKKPNFKIHFHKKNKLHFLFSDKKLDLNINSVWGNTYSIQNKYLIFKPNAYKLRIFLYHMKQKIISGIRLQGTGRLTKRLTASRSLSKVKYKGSLKNLNSSYENVSTVMLRGFVKSNLQYVNINNSSGNGSFGVKVSISVY